MQDGNFPVVQWLRLHASNAGGTVLSLVGKLACLAVWPKKEIKKKSLPLPAQQNKTGRPHFISV